MRLLTLILLTVSLAACMGNPQRLPVGIFSCDAVAQPNGFSVNAAVQNRADKPIASLALSLGFYRDFRYSQFTATAHLQKELDPGEKRTVHFDVTAPTTLNGPAMRCLVTHVGFMDGTSADLPPAQ